MGLGRFKTDIDLEKKGVWLPFDGFRVMVARAGGANENFKKLFTRLSEPHKRAMQHDLMDEKTGVDILHKVFAGSVVLGWQTDVDGEWVSGVDFEDGEGIQPYSKDVVLRVFDEFPDLFIQLREDSADAAHFRVIVREDNSEN